MSHYLVDACLWLDLPMGRNMVLVALCERANKETGKCWPGVREIAARASMTTRSVTRHLRALEEVGLLRSDEPSRTRGLSTRRWVNVERILTEGKSRRVEHQNGRPDKMTGHADHDRTLETEDRTSATTTGQLKQGDQTFETGRPDISEPRTVREPSVVTVIEEPSEEPLTAAPLTSLEIGLRKNYANSLTRRHYG